MEKYFITKEQILQLHKMNKEGNDQLVSCDLENWFPEVFKKEFTVEKWYKIDKNIFYCTEISERGTLYGYGIFDGKWEEYMNNGKSFSCACNSLAAKDRLTEATDEEVEIALIAEAKKRGYKKGEWCKFGNSGMIRKLDSDYIRWIEDWGGIGIGGLSIGGNIIFSDGEWAEIVTKNIKEITMNKAVKILSKKYGKKVTIK